MGSQGNAAECTYEFLFCYSGRYRYKEKNTQKKHVSAKNIWKLMFVSVTVSTDTVRLEYSMLINMFKKPVREDLNFLIQ